MACKDCTDVIRYTGPDIDELGISTGELLEVVLQNLTDYISGEGSGAISTLVNNADGTYTHNGGDVSGDATTFITGLHTTGATAPTITNYGDTWYDTSGTGELKWFANNGSTDVWVSVTPPNQDRFKEATVLHNSTTTLSITPNIHNKRELHYTSTGDMLLDGASHLTYDDFTYILTNTTAVSRNLLFSNISEARLRDGGAIVDLSATGIVIKANTSLLVTVTNNAGTISVNGHFPVDTGSNAFQPFNETFDIVANLPYTINVPTMVSLEAITLLSNTNEGITDGLVYKAVGTTVVVSSNVSLTGVQASLIISV